MKILEVLTQHGVYSLDRPFTYLYKGNKKVERGFRVLISFHNTSIVGYVLNVKETNKTKEEIDELLGIDCLFIDDVIDTQCLLNNELMELSRKISEYYLSPLISVLQAMLPPSLKPKFSYQNSAKIAYEKWIKIGTDNPIDLTTKQYEMYLDVKENGEVKKSELKSPAIVKKLLNNGTFVEFLKEKTRFKLPEYNDFSPKNLTQDQANVIDEFTNSNDTVFLLQGVTGSGKSEVYLRLAEKALNDGKSVIILVPEISLTPMVTRMFAERFKNNVAILHSQLTNAEKYDEYRKIARGDVKIVIGARSAIFAPVENLGLIVLDEEHSESYKQDVNPFYNAKDVAILRAKYNKAKVLLGSATPSLDSRARCQNGVYHLLKLTKRINEKDLPKTTIVDMGDLNNIDNDSMIFSLPLREKIQDRLNKNEQIMLLLNRRGFSSIISCRECGDVIKCPNCGKPLTYHVRGNLLKCHHCDYSEPMVSTCPNCGSHYLSKTGYGVERIEDEIKQLFPQARTLRLDSDNTAVRSSLFKTLTAFKNHEADILIGTQMIAKGHDFENVTLVGVVLADIGLKMPTYKASEENFQLITQAIGRSGRSELPGEAIIQTYMPDNYSIVHAANQDYDAFYLQEMKNRKDLYYPPYSYMASIVLSGENKDNVIQGAYDVTNYLKDNLKSSDTIILGPSTPYIGSYKTITYRSILVKYRDKKTTLKTLKQLTLPQMQRNNVKISINIDPYNF